MNYLFSASENSFYPVSMKNDYMLTGTWPTESLEVSEEVFKEFISLPPEGKVRGVVDGKPAWIDKDKVSEKEIEGENAAKKTQLLDEIYKTMAPLISAVDLDMASEEEKLKLDSYKKYQVLLSRVDISRPEWPALE